MAACTSRQRTAARLLLKRACAQVDQRNDLNIGIEENRVVVASDLDGWSIVGGYEFDYFPWLCL